MKSSVSEQSFLYESEDEEEDQENVMNRDEEDGNDSDSSDASTENQRRSKPNSYTTTWPQSYRYFNLFLISINKIHRFVL